MKQKIVRPSESCVTNLQNDSSSRSGENLLWERVLGWQEMAIGLETLELSKSKKDDQGRGQSSAKANPLIRQMHSTARLSEVNVGRVTQDENTQTLLIINVQLLTLKPAAIKGNRENLIKEIASTQRLVIESSQPINQFARARPHSQKPCAHCGNSFSGRFQHSDESEGHKEKILGKELSLRTNF